MAYEHDILKDALFVISHNLHHSVPLNISEWVSFENKIMSSLLVWWCDLTFVVFGVGQVEDSSNFPPTYFLLETGPFSPSIYNLCGHWRGTHPEWTWWRWSVTGGLSFLLGLTDLNLIPKVFDGHSLRLFITTKWDTPKMACTLRWHWHIVCWLFRQSCLETWLRHNYSCKNIRCLSNIHFFLITLFINFSQHNFEEFNVFNQISITKIGLFFPSGYKKIKQNLLRPLHLLIHSLIQHALELWPLST